MRNLKLWIWPGLVAVACLTALAIWFEIGPIESDLRSRATSALRQNHAWAQVLLKGRDLTLTGMAPDEESQKQALDIVRHVYGVRVARDGSALLPEEKPYRLTIEKAADGIRLHGFVPNEAARANLIAALTGMLPGIALSDQMKLARGAPTGLVSLAGYGLAAFPRFTTGSLEITDRTMRITGQALNPDDHEAALEALSSVPPSAGVVSTIEIEPAAVTGDYYWSAAISADGMTLNGYAPDLETRQALVERARTMAGGAGVEDRMRIAAGVPDGLDWLTAATEALSTASEMSGGQVVIRGKILDLSGEARDAEAFRRIQEALAAGLKGGLVLGTSDVGVAD